MLIWNKTGFVDGIPARDLTDEEVKKYGGKEYLLSTKCYEEPKQAEKKSTKKESE